MPIVIAGIINPPPAAPTLISPANGSSEDLADMPTFTWQYNPGRTGKAQTGWSFEVLINGGSTAQFWNATTNTWQTTEVWNAGSQQSYTFPDGAFTDGNTYQWTVATQDGNGVGPAAALYTVTSQAAPTVVVSAPSGIIITATPQVTWAVTTPKGAAQTSYRVVIYNNSQYSASGFTPGSGPSVYDTGQQGSSTVSSLNLATLPLYLPDGTQYRAYVQVTETGNELSAWAYSAFSTYYVQPKAPTITVAPSADATTGCPLIEIAVQSHDNLITSDNAIDPARGTTTGTWTAGTNTTLGSGSAPSINTFALSLTAQAAGNISGVDLVEYQGLHWPVDAGAEYTAVVSLIAATIGRNFTVGMTWYGPPGSGQIGVSTGSTFSDATTGLTQGYVTATAPEGAYFVGLVVTVEGADAGEAHWFQSAGVFPGTDTTWGPGGFVGNTSVILLRSDGLYVRGASMANPVQIPTPASTTVVSDYEAVPHANYTYTGWVAVVVGGTMFPALSPSVTSGPVTLVSDQWWEFDPTDPSGAINAQLAEWKPVQTEQSTAHPGTGAQVLTMVANTMLHQDFTGTAELFSDAVSTAFEALLSSQKTLFISSPWGTSDSGYFRVGPMTGGMSMGVGNQTKNTTLNKSIRGAGHRKVDVMAVAQSRPPV